MKNLKLIGAMIVTAGVLLTGCSEYDYYPNPLGNGEGSGAIVKNASEFTSEPIEGQYIVVLYANEAMRGNEQLVREQALELMNIVGVSQENIGWVYSNSILGFSVNMDRVMAEVMQAQPAVRYVEQDQMVHLNQFDGLGKPGGTPGGGNKGSDTSSSSDPAQVEPGGITRHGTASGVGKRAWIIDTGIDLDHRDLNVNTAKSRSFLTRGKSDPDDQNGHGSHVAGTVAAIDNAIGVIGIAAGAEVVSVRVLDRSGSGTYSGVIAGIDYVAGAASHGDAANMSLGGGFSQALNDAVNAAAQTCAFAVAAGNSKDNASSYSPASANGTGVWTISAMTTSDNWASFSCYGNPPVDYCAVGVSVLSCYKDNGYATLDGTSMATPHVCGLLLLNGGLNSVTTPLSTDGTVKNDPDGNADPIPVK